MVHVVFLSKDRGLIRFGLVWVFWPERVQVAPVKVKRNKLDWIDLEQWKIWLLGNVSLDTNWE